MEIFSLVCNEASTLTSLVKHRNKQWHSTVDLYWHNRSSPNCPHYWPVISFIRPVPSGPNLGLPTPACGVWGTQKTPDVASPWAPGNKIMQHIYIVGCLFLFFTQTKTSEQWGENESFAIQQENEMLRHWFTLGSEPQHLIIAMGVWSRPWYFRAGERQHSAVTMFALHESYSLCGLAAIKRKRMPCLS